MRLRAACLATLVTAAAALAAPMRCTLRTQDGRVAVAFEAMRAGALAGDVRITYPSLKTGQSRTITIARGDVSGYYFVHNRLLIYYSTLVDERAAILDVDYDVTASRGTLSLRFSPAALSSRQEMLPDAGQPDLVDLPLAQLEVH